MFDLVHCHMFVLGLAYITLIEKRAWKAHLMGEATNRDTEGPRKTKISQLQGVRSAVNEQVLGLQISVEHSVSVAIRHPLQHLIHVRLQAGIMRDSYSNTLPVHCHRTLRTTRKYLL